MSNYSIENFQPRETNSIQDQNNQALVLIIQKLIIALNDANARITKLGG